MMMKLWFYMKAKPSELLVLVRFSLLSVCCRAVLVIIWSKVTHYCIHFTFFHECGNVTTYCFKFMRYAADTSTLYKSVQNKHANMKLAKNTVTRKLNLCCPQHSSQSLIITGNKISNNVYLRDREIIFNHKSILSKWAWFASAQPPSPADQCYSLSNIPANSQLWAVLTPVTLELYKLFLPCSYFPFS